jgi:hypothetical protein
MNKNKIKIVDYFAGLINQLDLKVETLLIENELDENLTSCINKLRDTFINEIRYVEAYNLRSLSDMEIGPDEALTESDLFTKFCFFIKHVEKKEKKTFYINQLAEQEIGLRLVVTDRYLDNLQIKCCETLVNYRCLNDNEYLDHVFSELSDYVNRY